MIRRPAVLVALVVFAIAAFIHHVHNAEYLEHYPNMPVWLTPALVYAAWAAATAVGVLGYWLRQRALLILYGAYGIGSLAHYFVAPPSAHTAGMHFTIFCEMTAAAVLLIVIFLPLQSPSGAAPRRR